MLSFDKFQVFPRMTRRTAFPLALALALLGGRAAQAQIQPEAMASPPGTIRVVGEASITTKPDMAELEVGVVTEAKTAEEASTANARKMTRVIEAMKKELGAGADVKTVGLMVTQRYDTLKPGKRPELVGYTATNVIRARIPKIQTAGKIVDLALKSGANQVQRLVFTLKNPEQAQAQALKAAADRARVRARALADALGLRLGRIVSVSDSAAPSVPFEEVPYQRMSMKADADTPIEAGELEVHAAVTVFYATSPK